MWFDYAVSSLPCSSAFLQLGFFFFAFLPSTKSNWKLLSLTWTHLPWTKFYLTLYLYLNVNKSEKIIGRPFLLLESLTKLLDLIFCFQKCDTSKSVSTWSDNNGVACNDSDRCTRNDKCNNGQCRGTLLSCNSICQYCNGNSCGLKTGYGFSNSKCKCKMNGETFFFFNFLSRLIQ